MFWFCYYVIPAIAAWKWRSKDFVPSVYYLYGTMLASFLAVWCEVPVRRSLHHFLAMVPLLSRWATPIAMLLIWLITFVVWTSVLQRLAPDGLNDFTPPEKISKFLTPVVIFLHGGVACAMVFTVISAMPLESYTSFITKDPALCSGARYRLLWNSFFIDRASFQQAGITMRRRAFDRFVPEEVPRTPGK